MARRSSRRSAGSSRPARGRSIVRRGVARRSYGTRSRRTVSRRSSSRPQTVKVVIQQAPAPVAAAGAVSMTTLRKAKF